MPKRQSGRPRRMAGPFDISDAVQIDDSDLSGLMRLSDGDLFIRKDARGDEVLCVKSGDYPSDGMIPFARVKDLERCRTATDTLLTGLAYDPLGAYRKAHLICE
ncbi:MAG TPA: hypothetical protein VL944_00435 [Candidatus Acidoferrum sp.]|nr:hypothetical protein [Candidatus Acidoferrum sp.]